MVEILCFFSSVDKKAGGEQPHGSTRNRKKLYFLVCEVNVFVNLFIIYKYMLLMNKLLFIGDNAI